MAPTSGSEAPYQQPQFAVITWRDQEATYSKEYLFAEDYFRRWLSNHALVISEIPQDAGVDDVLRSHAWLADHSRWFVVQSPMVLMPRVALDYLSRLLDERQDLVCVAASEIGIDHPSNSSHYPYYTWRGFEAFQEAMIAQPPVMTPLVDRDPFVFMLDHSRVPSHLGTPPIRDLPGKLSTDQTAVAGNLFVHPLAGYYQYPRMDVVDLLPEQVTSLLDVGCGSGTFGQIVRETRGCRVVGIELNPAAAAKARLVLDDVVEGDVNNLNLEEQFDVITANDVLEHVENPEKVLRNLLEYLSPNGQIIVSIPNVGHWSIVEDLLAGRWDYLPAGLLCVDHLRFFTRKSMTSILQRAGWWPVRIQPIPGPMPDHTKERYRGLLEEETEIDIENLESQGYLIVAKRQGDQTTGRAD